MEGTIYMAMSEEVSPQQSPLSHEETATPRLQKNALGLPGVLALGIGAIAPAASIAFNIPVMASQAGAATPLVYLLSMASVLLLAVSIIYFARNISSAGGFTEWIRVAIGKKTALVIGWLIIGAYALFEAALQATVGGSLDINFSTLGFHLPGGWVTYALVLTLVVGVLGYLNIKTSIPVLAFFSILEVVGFLILDVAILAQGGAAGHDLVHTFTPAGATLKNLAPGGLLGIGLAMALGILSFEGFETVLSLGEETRRPKRTIPIAILGLILLLAVIYILTSYSVTIGVGWLHAQDVLGNAANAPQQYIDLANKFVGGWLGIGLVILVTSSNFASALAMHNAMTRYLFDLGRQDVLPGVGKVSGSVFGRAHPRWHSPYVASIAQTIFTIVVTLLLSLIIQHTNKDGSMSYAVGIADGKIFQQTSGVVSFGWLASIVTMCFLVIYIATNVAAPFFAYQRNELKGLVSVLAHIVAPVLSSLLLLLPLASYIGPLLPGIGGFFTGLGFAPLTFPSTILPVFVIVWILIGIIYAFYLARKSPERLENFGKALEQ
jgi:amino acid transporter